MTHGTVSRIHAGGPAGGRIRHQILLSALIAALLTLLCASGASARPYGALVAAQHATPHTVLASVPAAPGPLQWGDPLYLDLAPLNAVSCPSTRLCVAVDRAGGALWSTDPTGPAKSWHGTDIDGGNDLTGISCPSVSLCVAVDGSGDVATSTDPTGGARAWSVALVDGNSGAPNTDTGGSIVLRGVSCPSVSLCVAVDSVGDDVVSTDPTGGAGTWAAAYIDPGRSRGCTAAGLACQTPIVGVSCPSVSLCAAVDFAGNILATATPTAATPWTITATPGQIGSLWGISCPTSTFCAAPDGAGDRVVSFDPQAAAAFTTDRTSYGAYGIWCASESLCLATAESRHNVAGVLGTTNPTVRSPKYAFGAPGGINGIACPTAATCIAVDDEGAISAGASEAGVSAALFGDLLPSIHPTRGALAAAGSQTLHFASAIRGEVQLTWNSVPAHSAPPVRLATAEETFSKPGDVRVPLLFSAAGRAALRGKAKLTVSETATFVTSSGSVSRRRQVVFAGSPTQPASTHHHH